MTPADKVLFAEVAELAALPDTVTGYQVMADGSCGGPYIFPRNKDKVAIHWPPNVVPVAPPVTAEGDEAYWNGEAWLIRPSTALRSLPPDQESLQKRSADANGIYFPVTPPVRDEHGQWPFHVLNEDGTEWVWEYPPAPVIPE